jgi:hypothetical protein
MDMGTFLIEENFAVGSQVIAGAIQPPVLFSLN